MIGFLKNLFADTFIKRVVVLAVLVFAAALLVAALFQYTPDQIVLWLRDLFTGNL